MKKTLIIAAVVIAVAVAAFLLLSGGQDGPTVEFDTAKAENRNASMAELF